LAVLHGDPARENADMFLQVPGGSVLPITSTRRQNDVARCLSKQPCVLFIAFVQPVDAIPVTH